MNLCLDEAIASAVTEYGRLREHEGTERLGRLAHELRNLLNGAVLSFDILRSGSVAVGVNTGDVLQRSLSGLCNLIDRELAEVRLGAGVYQREPIVVCERLEDIEVAAAMGAKARGIHFSVASLHTSVKVRADRQLLGSAISNLLQNAFKFTHRAGHVLLAARATTERVTINVSDECGGLPPGKAEELFRPFEKRGRDQTGLGLGLAICLRGVQVSDGDIRVVNHPGTGCTFSIDLPRLSPESGSLGAAV